MPLKCLVSVVRLTSHFLAVPDRFGLVCLLRSSKARTIRAAVRWSDMFGVFFIGVEFGYFGVVD